MEIEVPEDLKTVCSEILLECRDESSWAAIETDDAFQRGCIVGGYDGTESAFTFSYYDSHGAEWWLQLSLSEVRDIVSGSKRAVSVRPAE